jgi:hypothetical protein
VDSLELQDQVVLEFSPDDTKAKDPENIKEFTTKMEEWFLALDGHKDRERFYHRAEELKTRFREYGISRPPQLVFLGRKIS